MKTIIVKLDASCSEPWWKCGKDDCEWFTFFNNIQKLNFNYDVIKESFGDFILDKENNK